MESKKLCNFGEDLAARYIKARGETVLSRSWTCHAGTIDVVSKDGNCLVFSSVWTRREPIPMQQPSEELKTRLRKIAAEYVKRESPETTTVRFDTIHVVVLGDNKALIHRYEESFACPVCHGALSVDDNNRITEKETE